MKVYLVMEGFEYEGESVKKVFADLAKAKEFRLQCVAEDVKEFYLGMGGGERKSFKDVKSYKRRKRWLA